MKAYESSFEDWVRWVFDQPVCDPAWYEDDECEWLEPPEESTLCADFLVRLFETPDRYMREFSDGQLNQGLNLILNPSISNHFFSLLHESIPLEKRIRGINAIFNVFRDVFAVRCTPHLGHLNEEGASALNSVCYMWWDICPFYGGRSEDGSADMAKAARLVMEKSLYLENDACRESALHGLGHLEIYEGQECHEVIDSFLKNAGNIRPELVKYAKIARTGCVQ